MFCLMYPLTLGVWVSREIWAFYVPYKVPPGLKGLSNRTLGQLVKLVGLATDNLTSSQNSYWYIVVPPAILGFKLDKLCIAQRNI